MQCPVCGVVNEPHRTQCDCGFELRAPEERVAQELQRRMGDVAPQMWIGAGVFGIALLVTIMTAVGAVKSGGEYFFVMFSAMGVRDCNGALDGGGDGTVPVHRDDHYRATQSSSRAASG